MKTMSKQFNGFLTYPYNTPLDTKGMHEVVQSFSSYQFCPICPRLYSFIDIQYLTTKMFKILHSHY